MGDSENLSLPRNKFILKKSILLQLFDKDKLMNEEGLGARPLRPSEHACLLCVGLWDKMFGIIFKLRWC